MFWHDLAALLGGCTVAELQERMDSGEFSRWIAWSRIRGAFGEDRGDLRNGILCALLSNVASAFGGQKGKAKPSDFMPFHKEPEKPAERVEQTKQHIKLIEQLLGVKEG